MNKEEIINTLNMAHDLISEAKKSLDLRNYENMLDYAFDYIEMTISDMNDGNPFTDTKPFEDFYFTEEELEEEIDKK